MRVLIYPDRQFTGWMRADGRALLIPTKTIASVTTTSTGIAFRQEVREEIADALTAAGHTVVDTTTNRQPRRDVHRWTHIHYVADEDDTTVLPPGTPGGHWQDETAQCPKCNPLHVRGAHQPQRISADEARRRMAD